MAMKSWMARERDDTCSAGGGLATAMSRAPRIDSPPRFTGSFGAGQGMVAVAAEAAARLLFFGLVHAPEMLARLVVMYFERRSAADPLEDQQGEEENEEASCVGGSVRLSQVSMTPPLGCDAGVSNGGV